MPTSYTSFLGLALPVTGELSGTWGDTVNDYITQYLDASVAGTQTISGSQTAVTLSKTTASSLSQAGSGATGSSQYSIINCTGNPASTLTVTISYTTLTNAQFSKSYIVVNATSTSQSVVVRATTSTGTSTGVTVAANDKALITWNGSDFVRVGASAGGSNTQVQYNSGGNLAGSANLTFDGTTLTAAGIADSSLTSGRVTYAGASGNLSDSSNFTFDGSNLQIGSQGDLRFGDSDNSNWVAFQAPATVASNVTWTLPSADGTSGQFLSTNGSGTLSFSTVTSPAQAGGALIVNTTTVNTSYTVPSGSNAFSVGPITIASGYAITVSSGQRWVVL